jgi:hypothetical protein
MIRVLFFPDIVGRPGRTAVKRYLSEKRDELKPDLVIADADNLASGRGPTIKTADEMLDDGIDVLTCGDHIWDQNEITDYLNNKDSKLLRPINYPKSSPGRGSLSFEVKGQKVLIISALGRVFTSEGLDNPFEVISEEIKSAKEKIIIVDFHAEATSEKVALGFFLAGKVSAVIGTHTHVQTSDERILKDHTAYISDSGSCAPYDSVIGVKAEQSIKRFTSGMPVKFDLAEGPTQVDAVLLEIDEKTGQAKSIKRIKEIFDN